MTAYRNKDHIFDPSLPIHPLMEKSNPMTLKNIHLFAIFILKESRSLVFVFV